MTADGVHSSVKAIQDMEAACARFARAVVEQLPEVEREFRQINEALEDRRMHLRQEIANLEDQSSSEDDSGENDDADIKSYRLAETEEELASVERRIRRLGETSANYLRKARAVENLATAHAVKAKEFLAGAEEDLRGYLSGKHKGHGTQAVILSSSLNSKIKSSYSKVIDDNDLESVHNARTKIQEIFQKAGIIDGTMITEENVKSLREALKKPDALAGSCLVDGDIKLECETQLNSSFIINVLNEFSSMLPKSIASHLPKLSISVKPLKSFGRYENRRLEIAADLDEGKARETLFHELAHWVHNHGQTWYRSAIRAHFEERTGDEPIVHIEGYPDHVVGKLDNWRNTYAGRVYPAEKGTPNGLEIPSTHFQLLALPDDELADYLNDHSVRETMKITLSALI